MYKNERGLPHLHCKVKLEDTVQPREQGERLPGGHTGRKNSGKISISMNIQ